MVVVNMRDYRYKHMLDENFRHWQYIGRGSSAFGLQRSSLGNPYQTNGQRGSTIGRYRKWLWKEIQRGNRGVLEELESIRPETALVCHCPQPGPCHGHVVMKAAEWLQSEAGKSYRRPAGS